MFAEYIFERKHIFYFEMSIYDPLAWIARGRITIIKKIKGYAD